MPRIENAARNAAGTALATQARRVLKAAARLRRAPAAGLAGSAIWSSSTCADMRHYCYRS